MKYISIILIICIFCNLSIAAESDKSIVISSDEIEKSVEVAFDKTMQHLKEEGLLPTHKADDEELRIVEKKLKRVNTANLIYSVGGTYSWAVTCIVILSNLLDGVLKYHDVVSGQRLLITTMAATLGAISGFVLSNRSKKSEARQEDYKEAYLRLRDSAIFKECGEECRVDLDFGNKLRLLFAFTYSEGGTQGSAAIGSAVESFILSSMIRKIRDKKGIAETNLLNELDKLLRRAKFKLSNEMEKVVSALAEADISSEDMNISRLEIPVTFENEVHAGFTCLGKKYKSIDAFNDDMGKIGLRIVSRSGRRYLTKNATMMSMSDKSGNLSVLPAADACRQLTGTLSEHLADLKK